VVPKPGVAWMDFASRRVPLAYLWSMEQPREVELVFTPQEEGGLHVFAPDLPGRHTQGDTLEEAMASASEALELYVDEGRLGGCASARGSHVRMRHRSGAHSSQCRSTKSSSAERSPAS
jgi:predicted RNase H-like HicB family nuclease